MHTLKPHPKPVISIDLSVDARVIASSSANQIKVWDSGKQLFQFKDGDGAVTQIAINPVSMTLSSGHFDRMIRNWDLSKGKLVQFYNYYFRLIKPPEIQLQFRNLYSQMMESV